jgi:hypothetical protein
LLALQSAGPRAKFVLDDLLVLLNDLQIAQATKVDTRGLNRSLLTYTLESQAAILQVLLAMDQDAAPAIDPLIDFFNKSYQLNPQIFHGPNNIVSNLLAVFRNLSPPAEQRLIEKLNESTVIDETNVGAFVLLQELNPAAAKEIADRAKDNKSE